jgi:hypothetical protein
VKPTAFHVATLLLSAIAAWVGAGSLVARAADPAPIPPVLPWQVGDSWQIDVQQYPRDAPVVAPAPKTPGAKPPAGPAPYRVTVRVAGTEDFAGLSCWQLDYTPAPTAPPTAGAGCRVLVRRKDGWPCRILIGEEVRGDLFDLINGLPVVTGAPVGLPVELFPLPETTELKAPDRPLSLRFLSRRFEQTEVQDVFVLRGGGGDLMFTQVWRKGEKCWREYDRFYKLRKDLSARVVDAAALSPVPLPPGPVMAKLSDEDIKPMAGEDTAHLRDDPRLRVKISADLPGPTAPDIVRRLQEATGVPLECGEGVSRRRPAYGGVHWQNCPAWNLMVELTATEAVAGRWEKDGDGYRLTGTAAPDKEDLPPAREHGITGPLRWWLTGGSLAAFAGMVCWLGYYHFWKKKQAPSEQPPS